MYNLPGLGILKSKHSPPKIFVFFAVGIFLFLSGLAWLIYVKTIIPAEKQNHLSFSSVNYNTNLSGEIDWPYWVIIFIMMIAVAILLTAVIFTLGKSYYIYERGIVTENSGQFKTILFEDIDDLGLFSSGNSFNPNNIAFRNRKEGQWEIITARNRHIFKAIDLISSYHKVLYTAKVFKELEVGKCTIFNYISYPSLNEITANGEPFTRSGNSFLNLTPKEIRVYRHYLIIDELKLRIVDISRFITDDDSISLYNKDNKIAFTTSLMGFFSSESFITVLHRLIRMSREL
jgi:hypothetical protein